MVTEVTFTTTSMVVTAKPGVTIRYVHDENDKLTGFYTAVNPYISALLMLEYIFISD